MLTSLSRCCRQPPADGSTRKCEIWETRHLPNEEERERCCRGGSHLTISSIKRPIDPERFVQERRLCVSTLATWNGAPDRIRTCDLCLRRARGSAQSLQNNGSKQLTVRPRGSPGN